MPLPDATRHRWDTSGNKSQRVAARLDAWAARQPSGTIVPATDVIITWFPTITGRNAATSKNTPACVQRAVRLLADHHVLRRDRDTGHYYVAATGRAVQCQGPAGT